VTRLVGQTTNSDKEMLCILKSILTHGRGLYQEAASNTSDRETNELSGHDNHPLVWAYRQ